MECEERTSKGTETKHGQSSVPFLILNFLLGSFPDWFSDWALVPFAIACSL
ncbi:hypothetical protein BH23CYA1_BH23CYA1_07940 [soil metagenome]